MINAFLDNIKGELGSYTSKLSPLYAKVLKQSLRHTTRSDMDELHNVARPSEDKEFTDWRNNNKRHLTVDFIIQFTRMLQRILSATLKLEYNYDKLERFIFDTIIPLSIQDPNAVVILWPTIGELDAPPALNGDNTTRLTTKHKIIYSNRIKQIDDDLLIYYHDKVLVDKTPHDRYIGIDKIGYYLITPYKYKDKILYKTELWYAHEINQLPVIILPGINVNIFIDDTPYKYKESIAWPAFENFDEGVIRLSSEQVASIKHANPKLIINGDIKCPACSGTKNIYGVDKKAYPCTSCNGTGTLRVLGDFSTLKIENGKGDFDKSHDNPIFYLNPPEGLDYLRKSWKEFFEDGKRSLCNDLLQGTPNESGIAKELRLEPRQDLMKSFGKAICWFVEDLVNFNLILTGEGENSLIKVTPPAYYQTKSPDILKSEITEALQGERYMKYIEYINTIFKGNDLQIKIHMFSALYAPLMLYKADEIDSVFNAGAYDEKDIKRRDMAIYAITKIVTKNPDIELKKAKEEADKLLIDEGFLSEERKIPIGQLESVA